MEGRYRQGARVALDCLSRIHTLPVWAKEASSPDWLGPGPILCASDYDGAGRLREHQFPALVTVVSQSELPLSTG